MTVTTGGRGSASAAVRACGFREQRVGIVELRGCGLVAHLLATIIAVSWSSTWLIVTICPSFISVLMTSAAFTDILCARSATEIVSGTVMSRISGSAGRRAVRRRRRRGASGADPCGTLQPVDAAAPGVSPRVLSALRRATSSCHAVAGALLAACRFLLRPAWPPADAACLRWPSASRPAWPPRRGLRGFALAAAAAFAPHLRQRRAASASLRSRSRSLLRPCCSLGLPRRTARPACAPLPRGSRSARRDARASSAAWRRGTPARAGGCGSFDSGGSVRAPAARRSARLPARLPRPIRAARDDFLRRPAPRSAASATGARRFRRRFALDEHALLAHLDLDRARLAGGARLLDLGRLLADDA